MSSLAPERMRDAPVTATLAKLATPKPSPLQRLAALWRRARSAALLHALVDYDEPGHPSPHRLAPRVHPTLRGLAHPATWEVGIPLTLVTYAGWILDDGWDRVLPRHREGRILFALMIPIVVFFFAFVGRALLNRRYTRLAFEEYHRVRWQHPDGEADA